MSDMTHEEHRERHKLLHQYLDELIADMIRHTPKLPSTTTVTQLMEWSYQQTVEPTETNSPASSQADGAVTSSNKVKND